MAASDFNSAARRLYNGQHITRGTSQPHIEDSSSRYQPQERATVENPDIGGFSYNRTRSGSIYGRISEHDSKLDYDFSPRETREETLRGYTSSMDRGRSSRYSEENSRQSFIPRMTEAPDYSSRDTTYGTYNHDSSRPSYADYNPPVIRDRSQRSPFGRNDASWVETRERPRSQSSGYDSYTAYASDLLRQAEERIREASGGSLRTILPDKYGSHGTSHDLRSSHDFQSRPISSKLDTRSHDFSRKEPVVDRDSFAARYRTETHPVSQDFTMGGSRYSQDPNFVERYSKPISAADIKARIQHQRELKYRKT